MASHQMATFQFPQGARSTARPLRRAVLLAMAGVGVWSSTASAADTLAANSAARQTLTLSQAEESALRNQPTLRQAQAQTDAAQGRVEQARSGYLPQAAFNGVYERTTFQPRPTPGITPQNGLDP